MIGWEEFIARFGLPMAAQQQQQVPITSFMGQEPPPVPYMPEQPPMPEPTPKVGAGGMVRRKR